jgi:hypothetical protein
MSEKKAKLKRSQIASFSIGVDFLSICHRVLPINDAIDP